MYEKERESRKYVRERESLIEFKCAVKYVNKANTVQVLKSNFSRFIIVA